MNKRRWIKRYHWDGPNKKSHEKYLSKLSRRKFRRQFNHLPIHQMDFEDLEVGVYTEPKRYDWY